jgi:hypothetical protein
MTLKTLFACPRASLGFDGFSTGGVLPSQGRISPEGLELLAQMDRETQTRPDPYAKTNEKVAELRQATNDLGLIIMQIKVQREQHQNPFPVDDETWKKLEGAAGRERPSRAPGSHEPLQPADRRGA